MLKTKSLILFLLFLFAGCSSSSISEKISLFFNSDGNVVRINNDDFNKIRNNSYNSYIYAGFGMMESIRPGRIESIKPEFENILYNFQDSVLYIKGRAFSGTTPLDEGQIIIGRMPENCTEGYTNRIDIKYNYIMNDEGEFETTIPVTDSLQVIFASREIYDDNGEYKYIELRYIDVYDIYKLSEIYQSK